MRLPAVFIALTIAAPLFASADRSPVRDQTRAAPAAGESAVTVVLLLDVSASVSRLPMFVETRFVQVFNAFARGLRPGDRAGVGVISRRFQSSALVSDTRDLPTIGRRLLQVPDADRLGPSPIWDGIDSAITLVEASNGRLAVVLLSDGKSTGNVRGLQEVTEHARQARVSINAVIEGDSSQGPIPPGLDPAELIGSIVRTTGGRLLVDRPANPRDRNPAPLITQIMEGLR
jgi:Mg-chelatase subunit ChlD